MYNYLIFKCLSKNGNQYSRHRVLPKNVWKKTNGVIENKIQTSIVGMQLIVCVKRFKNLR